MPSSASIRSKLAISWNARFHWCSAAKPSTRSTSTRPYQERSSTAMPPQPGSAGQKRQRKWCRNSSRVGAANWATRTWRGSSGSTRLLMHPPLPDASHPSNTTQTGGPTSSFSFGSSRPAINKRRRNRSCCASARRAASSDAVSFLVRSRAPRAPWSDKESAPVPVGDRDPAVLAERLRSDAYADRGLPPLVLGDVDQPHDPLHRFRVEAEIDQLRDREVVLHVPLDDGVEDLVRRQALVVSLVGPQLGGGRLGQDRFRDRPIIGTDAVAIVTEAVDEQLRYIAQDGEA